MEKGSASPRDLGHLFSKTAVNRKPSAIKQYYKFFAIPGVGNLAGGLPNSRFFPFETLEAQSAKPERWTPTPNYPDGEDDHLDATGNGSQPKAATHLTVPMASGEKDPVKKIDLETALQYGTGEGYPPLLSFVRQFSQRVLHPNVPHSAGVDVVMTCGSTDGFSKTLELFNNPWSEGDPISRKQGLLCEIFMYSNVLSQSQPRGMNIVPVEMDADGMLAHGTGGLEDVLENWDSSKGQRPHMLYTNGPQPNGRGAPVRRRKELYAICQKYDVIIVEDDPYWYLQYPSADRAEARSRQKPEPTTQVPPAPAKSSGYEFIDSLVPSFLSIDVDGRVVRLDTFSKTVAPGCRLGWITAQPAFIERYVRITETSTQQPSGFVQSMIAQLLLGHQTETVARFLSLGSKERQTFAGWSTDGWVRWLAGLRGSYERRMNRMCAIIDEYSYEPRVASKRPGLDSDWAYVRLHRHRCFGQQGKSRTIDGPLISAALMIYLTHAPYKVLVAPGSMFAANDDIRQTLAWSWFRICFAAEAEEKIDDCAHRFGTGVREFFKIKNPEDIEELYEEFEPRMLESPDAADAFSGLGC
ncbi:unnamed protein product [Parascedosporium putredinis]|uniref:Aminotransferase class I/classII large domain-containing protein n=1 Tax=Parascedosporium putredinis TaxID=1442378 RepID=A0A9P1M6J0_9PEZI|nr:unnamed protein product [Parascedosporium putredinis]CAI7987402.1 unnamed protein product [Parascedosporium putredinis]